MLLAHNRQRGWRRMGRGRPSPASSRLRAYLNGTVSICRRRRPSPISCEAVDAAAGARGDGPARRHADGGHRARSTHRSSISARGSKRRLIFPTRDSTSSRVKTPRDELSEIRDAMPALIEIGRSWPRRSARAAPVRSSPAGPMPASRAVQCARRRSAGDCHGDSRHDARPADRARGREWARAHHRRHGRAVREARDEIEAEGVRRAQAGAAGRGAHAGDCRRKRTVTRRVTDALIEAVASRALRRSNQSRSSAAVEHRRHSTRATKKATPVCCDDAARDLRDAPR